MTKLAAAIGGNDRESLKEFVLSGDTSVPGIEHSDLNDGDILARTRENVNPNGQFQFVYIPESGDPITSDWVGQDFKKQVLRGWVDGVKSAIIARGHAGITAANEAAMEERLKRLQREQMEDDAAIPEAIEPAKANSTQSAAVNVRQQPTILAGSRQSIREQSSNPTDYVEDQLDIARERLRAAEQAQQDIVREVLTARRDYEKWKALDAALRGIGGDDSGVRSIPEPIGQIDTATSVSRVSGNIKRI
jgi:hypothetical protein